MYCISVSYKSANVAVREKIAFSAEEQERFIKDNMIILSTCNRVEIYFTDYDLITVGKYICKFKNIDYRAYKAYVNIYGGEGAILHLYRVACGLESKILGEDEILGQVKDAYYFAHNNVKLSYELNTIFKGAITAAKKIKTETLMSKSAVSIGTITAGFIHSRNIKNVMIIGISGKVGTILAKNLLSYGDINIIATARGHNADYISVTGAEYIPFSKRYEYMKNCGAAISATTSPHYTVMANDMERYNIRNKILIDLAVPRDIDEDIKDNEIYNIDYFETISKNNSEIKIREKDRIEAIIESMIDDLKKEMFFHRIAPNINDLNKYSFEHMIYKVRDGLTANEFEKFINILKE